MLFTTTTLAPDTQRIVAWAVQEALVWLQSASPAELAVGVWTASLGLAGVLVVWGRGLK